MHGRPVAGTNLDPWSLLLATLYMLDRIMMPGSLLRSRFVMNSLGYYYRFQYSFVTKVFGPLSVWHPDN